MSVFDKIYRQAKKELKTIVLPEGDEPRVIQAAQEVAREGLARIILLGKKKEKLDEYAESFYKLRKDKGVTKKSARDLLLQDPIYYGAMMLREGAVDGFVAGARYTTSHVARALLRCIEGDVNYITASGGFLIEVKDKAFGQEGLFLFADCAIVPLPTSKQLADIALNSAEIWTKITKYEPRVAMLSFSSRSSSSHPLLDNIKEATEIAKAKRTDLIIDGELQADSAIVPSVARIKVPASSLKGRANILIFPNLSAGNIAYKLMQRLAGARVVGPIIQGLSKPCSDLSRGCNVREIVDAIAVTCVRAQ